MVSSVSLCVQLDKSQADLELLSSHKSVLGYLLLTRSSSVGGVSIVRQSGTIFEGESGKRYATSISKMVESVQSALDEIGGEDSAVHDEVRFLRIRTRRHEIIISPGLSLALEEVEFADNLADDRYLLAVLHDPA